MDELRYGIPSADPPKEQKLELLHERSNVGSLKDLGEMGLLAAIILFSLGSVLLCLW